jgi:uncharacterized repeat protein (TIGR03803 family)
MWSATLAFLAVNLLLGAAWAQKETVLYKFCVLASCADGANPIAGLVLDAKGNLYGTTQYGGTHGGGAIFKVTPSGKERVLYSFCSQSNCTDGANPYGGVTFDAKGNLYGTAEYGGVYGYGAVFKLSPSGMETNLYSFCPQKYCYDGELPMGGVVLDKQGNIYGTTSGVYDQNGGSVFKVTPSGEETVLYGFGGGPDGGYPYAGLVQDAEGNVYGTTFFGGDSQCNLGAGCGVVFKVDSSGKETVLHAFTGGSDGAFPYDPLFLDSEGNLYGTTSGFGGAGNDSTVFKVTPSGVERVLYRFSIGYMDGAFPSAGVVLDSKGDLYGTTYEGGWFLHGAAFRLSPAGTETVLHSFVGAGGANPWAGVVLDKQGNLYGTTFDGGIPGCLNKEFCGCANHKGCGVVFKLTP